MATRRARFELSSPSVVAPRSFDAGNDRAPVHPSCCSVVDVFSNGWERVNFLRHTPAVGDGAAVNNASRRHRCERAMQEVRLMQTHRRHAAIWLRYACKSFRGRSLTVVAVWFTQFTGARLCSRQIPCRSSRELPYRLPICNGIVIQNTVGG